jgi:hypothetical protein
MPAGVMVAFLALLAIAAAFAAFAIGSVDLRITMAVAIVTGIAATVAANTNSQDIARGSAWLGAWISLAFLIGGAMQAFWNVASITVPLLDARCAAFLALIAVKLATVVSRRV